MQNLFIRQKPSAPNDKQPVKKPNLFSRVVTPFLKAALLFNVLAAPTCGGGEGESRNGGPRGEGEGEGEVNNNKDNDAGNKIVTDGGMVVLSEPEPCVTSDRVYSFSWQELTDDQQQFIGFNNPIFPSSPIKMIWVMDLSEHAADRQFFTGGEYREDGNYREHGTFTQLESVRRLVRPGFRLHPNPDYRWSREYAIAFLCAEREGTEGISLDLLWRIMSTNRIFGEYDLYFFTRDASGGGALSVTGFGACRTSLADFIIYKEPDPRIVERLEYDHERIAAAGIPDDMPTPVFVLFNPENNRCRSIVGVQPIENFFDVIRYLGVDPDNWPPPSR